MASSVTAQRYLKQVIIPAQPKQVRGQVYSCYDSKIIALAGYSYDTVQKPEKLILVEVFTNCSGGTIQLRHIGRTPVEERFTHEIVTTPKSLERDDNLG